MRSSFFSAEKTNAQAGAWLARLQAGDLSVADQENFQAWLAADPAHAAAFESATNIWDRLGGVPREIFRPKEKEKSGLSRRGLLAGAAGIVVVGSVLPFLHKAEAKTYKTAVGQQTRIALGDGSALFLDTNTEVSVDLSGEMRLVELRGGRVNCRVAQGDRPFCVKAKERLVVGNRAVFDVATDGDYYSVVQIDGTAELRDAAISPIALHPGDRATATRSNPIWRDRPDMASLTAWQSGRLIFKDETVAEAAAQMNRYSPLKIEIDDSRVGALRMSGGYAVGDTLGFAISLSQLLPINVHPGAGRIQLTGRAVTNLKSPI